VDTVARRGRTDCFHVTVHDADGMHEQQEVHHIVQLDIVRSGMARLAEETGQVNSIVLWVVAQERRDDAAGHPLAHE
jgi:hypothetical protein